MFSTSYLSSFHSAKLGGQREPRDFIPVLIPALGYYIQHEEEPLALLPNYRTEGRVQRAKERGFLEGWMSLKSVTLFSSSRCLISDRSNYKNKLCAKTMCMISSGKRREYSQTSYGVTIRLFTIHSCAFP